MAPARTRLTAAVVIATVGILASGQPLAEGQAPPTGTISVSEACFVNTAAAAAKIAITGSGWEGGATIEITDALGVISATATPSASGAFMTTVPAPVVDSYAHPEVSDTIEAYYEGTPAMTSSSQGTTAESAPFLTTNFAVLPSGSVAHPHTVTTFELSGFRPGRTVYAHYLSPHGTLLRTVAFGRPAGPCGLRRVRTDTYPGGHPRPGGFTIQFDDARRYRRLTAPQFRLSFTVPGR